MSHTEYMREWRKKQKKGNSLLDCWPDLPASARVEDDVKWCYDNIEAGIRRKKNGEFDIDWGRIKERPPSRGVEHWANLRINHPGQYGMEVSKILRGGGDDDAERDRGERMRLEELRALLTQMRLERDGTG
jgi:hypothetical protein